MTCATYNGISADGTRIITGHRWFDGKVNLKNVLKALDINETSYVTGSVTVDHVENKVVLPKTVLEDLVRCSLTDTFHLMDVLDDMMNYTQLDFGKKLCFKKTVDELSIARYEISDIDQTSATFESHPTPNTWLIFLTGIELPDTVYSAVMMTYSESTHSYNDPRNIPTEETYELIEDDIPTEESYEDDYESMALDGDMEITEELHQDEQ